MVLPVAMTRKHIIFIGRVQGVGFRYHAYYKAKQLGLTGWVRNVYDGNVELEVQGKETVIDELIMHLSRQRFIQIEDIRVKTIPVVEERDKYDLHMKAERYISEESLPDADRRFIRE